MPKNLISTAEITIDAPVALVWDALINPETIKRYMFDTTVVSEWKEGSSIVWKGEWEGKRYEDKGIILKILPERMLRYSHYSPLQGDPDVPESYRNVTLILTPQGNKTQVELSQDNNKDEESREKSEGMWNMMLEGLKKLLEA